MWGSRGDSHCWQICHRPWLFVCLCYFGQFVKDQEETECSSHCLKPQCHSEQWVNEQDSPPAGGRVNELLLSGIINARLLPGRTKNSPLPFLSLLLILNLAVFYSSTQLVFFHTRGGFGGETSGSWGTGWFLHAQIIRGNTVFRSKMDQTEVGGSHSRGTFSTLLSILFLFAENIQLLLHLCNGHAIM